MFCFDFMLLFIFSFNISEWLLHTESLKAFCRLYKSILRMKTINIFVRGFGFFLRCL